MSVSASAPEAPRVGGAPTSSPPPGGPLMHAPSTGLKPTDQLDNNDLLAIILTVFFPGVGHMMVGQTTKGIAILAATYLTCGLGYVAFALVAIDCYMVAMARKKRPVDDWEFFPKP